MRRRERDPFRPFRCFRVRLRLSSLPTFGSHDSHPWYVPPCPVSSVPVPGVPCPRVRARARVHGCPNLIRGGTASSGTSVAARSCLLASGLFMFGAVCSVTPCLAFASVKVREETCLLSPSGPGRYLAASHTSHIGPMQRCTLHILQIFSWHPSSQEERNRFAEPGPRIDEPRVLERCETS
jgi:hypothetical protein